MTLLEANKLQLQHKGIPHDISFLDQDGQKVHYTIKHEDEQNASYIDFHVEDYLEDNEVLATMQDMTDCFKLEKEQTNTNNFAPA